LRKKQIELLNNYYNGKKEPQKPEEKLAGFVRWEAGMQITDCSAYEILQKERIEDVHADGYLLRHKKSGGKSDASGKSGRE
jgi:hypothetical protein